MNGKPLKEKALLCLKLYLAFFKIGLFTFGGGYAMLPMLERECVDHYGWTDREELLDIFAMGQCTPGVIAVNTATFLGRKTAGFFGALLGTLGVITPSIIIITIIAAVLQNFADLAPVRHAMAAVRCAVTALIFASVIKMVRSSIKTAAQVVLLILAFLAVAIFGASPVVVVIAAAVYGFFFTNLSKMEQQEDTNHA